MTQEALKLALDALEYWDVHGKLHQPTEEAITAIKEALAQTQEPVAWWVTSPDGEIDWSDEPIQYKEQRPLEELVDGCGYAPLYTSPPQRTWVGLMRGVRVDGDTVVITVKGGNDAARELCGELLKEKNT